MKNSHYHVRPEQDAITSRYVYHFIIPTVILSLQSGGNRNTNNVSTAISAQGIIRYMA